jgi:hypothetical protein
MKSRYPWEKEYKFSDEDMEMIDRINAFLTQPRSPRWIYYAVFDAPDAKKQRYLSERILNRARKDRRELISRDMVTDDTRSPTIWRTNEDLEEFVRELEYTRDVWQNQPEYLEVWMEDQASLNSVKLSPRRILQKWRMNARFCKGFNSVSAMWNAYKYFKSFEKPVRILYYGDLNPSGWAVPIIVVRQFKELGLDIALERLTLNPPQLDEFDIEAFTKISADPRRPEFNRTFGYDAWENEPDQEYRDENTGKIKLGKRHLNIDMEKIPPDAFEDMLDRDIMEWIDYGAFCDTALEEDRERERLQTHVDAILEGD